MTRVLEIVGTGIRLVIENCEYCPMFGQDDAPPTEWCELTGNEILVWAECDADEAGCHHAPNGKYYHNEKRDPQCPLPEKKE